MISRNEQTRSEHFNYQFVMTLADTVTKEGGAKIPYLYLDHKINYRYKMPGNTSVM